MQYVHEIFASTRFSRYVNELKVDGTTIGYLNFRCRFNYPIHVQERLFTQDVRLSIRALERDATAKTIAFRKRRYNYEVVDQFGEYTELNDDFEGNENQGYGEVCGKMIYFAPVKVDNSLVTSINISLYVKRKMYTEICQFRDALNFFAFSCAGSIRECPPEDYRWDGDELEIIAYKYGIYGKGTDDI